jgi:hypothetical protein
MQGYVATCTRFRLSLHTINGRPIAALDISATSPSHFFITSLAFLEREYAQVDILATGGSDGTIALRTWNTDATPPEAKAVWQFTTLRTLNIREDGDWLRSPAASPMPMASVVTALKFVGCVSSASLMSKEVRLIVDQGDALSRRRQREGVLVGGTRLIVEF